MMRIVATKINTSVGNVHSAAVTLASHFHHLHRETGQLHEALE